MSSWRSLVLRLGEKCPEYDEITEHKDQIETCLGVVCSELSESGDEILSFLLQCAEGLPHKAPLYGTLVGLINLEDEDFARKALDGIHGSLQDALHDGNCNRIRVLMRFLTTLMCSKVLQPTSLIVLFETLISSAATTVDEEKGNPCWQSCADFYIISVLSCLPWGGAELFEQVPAEIDRVMVGIQAYMSIRKHVSDAGYSVFNYIDGRTQEDDEKDFLEDLWGRIQDLSNKDWKLDSVPRPHLSFEDQLGAGKSYDLGLVNCPELPDPPIDSSLIACGKQKHEADLKYPLRIRRLQIFPASKTGDLQPIDRFIMEEYLLDVLLFLNGCRKECASSMVGLPVPFRYEYLMAETIFSQILLLPNPPFKPVYYTLVIMDLCKALPGAFPAVVASAVRSLFNKISDLDMECRNRLVLWFSHHLSNFQFIWPWEEWSHVLDLPKWAPQRVFVQEVLEREVRLSYWDRIKQSIESAPALEELLPPKGTPNFIYSGEDGDQTERDLSSELSRMVKERTMSQEMLKWVEEQVIPAQGLDVTLRVVAQTLLNIGSKSFTHLITVLERFGQIFSRLCSDDDKQIMLINEVSSFWKNNAQMTAICIDRMMGYRIVSNVAIIRWVFSEVNVDQFHISDRPWEILRNSISKTFNRIADLKKEISSLKKGVESAAKAASKAVNELEDFKSKLTLTLVNGEPVLDENPLKMKRMNLNIERTKAAEISTRESLESKEVLVGQAITELQELLLLLFKSFARVLAERIKETDGLLSFLGERAEMAVDQEDVFTMELNADDEQQEKSHPNGEKPKNGYNLGEREQWCLSTLGYVKAITRQYASEIWPLVEKLDADVLTEDVHPLFRDAVYSGLCRPIAS